MSVHKQNLILYTVRERMYGVSSETENIRLPQRQCVEKLRVEWK